MENNRILKSFRKLFREYNTYSKKFKNICGLNSSHISCLVYLQDSGSKSVSELSNYLVLSPSTVTSLIDQLEKEKYIVRKSSTIDKRITHISIKSKGKKFLKDAPEIFEDKLVDSLGLLTGNEQESLNRLLQIVLKNIYLREQPALPVKVFFMHSNDGK